MLVRDAECLDTKTQRKDEKTGTSTGSLTSQQYGRHVLQAPHCSSPPSEACARDTPFLPLQIPAGKEMWSSRVRLSFESTRKDQLDQQLWFFMFSHVVWKQKSPATKLRADGTFRRATQAFSPADKSSWKHTSRKDQVFQRVANTGRPYVKMYSLRTIEPHQKYSI